MDKFNRSLTSLGLAFLFVTVLATAFLVRAAGIRIELSPSLSAVSDAWTEIAGLIGNSQPFLIGTTSATFLEREESQPLAYSELKLDRAEATCNQTVQEEFASVAGFVAPTRDWPARSLGDAPEIAKQNRTLVKCSILPKLYLPRVALAHSRALSNIMAVKARLDNIRVEREATERAQIAIAARRAREEARRLLREENVTRVIVKARLSPCEGTKSKPAPREEADLVILSAGDEPLTDLMNTLTTVEVVTTLPFEPEF